MSVEEVEWIFGRAGSEIRVCNFCSENLNRRGRQFEAGQLGSVESNRGWEVWQWGDHVLKI